VTLAAKPVDTARIIWAKEKGHITLVLRRPNEDEAGNVPAVVTLDERDGGPPPTRRDWPKVWVARENVAPGQIEKPEELFKLEEVPPTLAAHAFQGPTPPPPGRLYHLVVQGMPVTPQHYKAIIDIERTGSTGGTHYVTVVTPNQEPRIYPFTQDGRPLNGGKPMTELPETMPPGGK
jgi:hypothetical protein